MSYVIADFKKRVSCVIIKWIVLLGISVALIFCSFLFATSDTILSKIYIALICSVLIEATLILIVVANNAKLRNFFGGSIASGEFRLIYPEFIRNEAFFSKESSDIENETILYRPDFEAECNIPSCNIYVPKTVASNDLLSLRTMNRFLLREGYSPTIESVEMAYKAQQSEYGFVSFGFTSNLFSKICIKETAMFTVEKDASRYKEKIVFKREKTTLEFKSDNSRQIGVVCRHNPSPLHSDNAYWFMCGGIGPHGTEAAAAFLAKEWNFIRKKVNSDDFFAIVTVQIDPYLCIPDLAFIATRTSIIYDDNTTPVRHNA